MKYLKGKYETYECPDCGNTIGYEKLLDMMFQTAEVEESFIEEQPHKTYDLMQMWDRAEIIRELDNPIIKCKNCDSGKQWIGF